MVVVGVEARVEDEVVARRPSRRRRRRRPRRRSSRPSGRGRPGGRRRSRTRGTAPARGSPSGRYGVSAWRCATQPQAVRLSKVRAQPTSASRELLERAREPRPPSRSRDRVGVQEDDDRARRLVPAGVARAAREPGRVVADDARSGGLRDGARAVGGAVVHDDDLGGSRLLRAERLDDSADRALGVERGDDDGDVELSAHCR